jgi:large subunit ribosomal protein L9
MKVILLKDFPKLGKKNDIKEVNEGYARNLLLPSKIAVIATDETIQKIKTAKESVKVMRSVQEDLLKKNLSELEGKEITLIKKSNEHGHLFSALNSTEISQQMKKEHGIDIDGDTIVFPKPIKELGDHVATVKIKGKSAEFKIKVTNK